MTLHHRFGTNMRMPVRLYNKIAFLFSFRKLVLQNVYDKSAILLQGIQNIRLYYKSISNQVYIHPLEGSDGN